jgi:AcrR family transcriptional regulator
VQPVVVASPTTRDALLEAAADLLQRVGYASFSYRDLGAAVGIRAPSIHYHFPTKSDLGLALVEHFRSSTQAREAELCAAHPRVRPRLLALADQIARSSCPSGKACPITMLEADYGSLTPKLQRAVTRLIDEKLAILARWLDEGRRAGELRFPGQPAAQARLVWSVIEHGTQLVRSHPGQSLKALVRQLVDTMTP